MKITGFITTLLVVTLLTLLMLGCNNEVPSTTEVLKEKKMSRVEQAVNDAISTHDYRLYGMTGRRVTLPGLESENINDIKQRCGIRLLAGTGDTLKNSQDRTNRRSNYQFALKVNQKLYPLCLKNKNKDK
jgi:hypothetical protein